MMVSAGGSDWRRNQDVVNSQSGRGGLELVIVVPSLDRLSILWNHISDDRVVEAE